MFELLEVKIKEPKPTPLNLLDKYYGRSSIIMKGKNGKWYEIEDGHGADLVWIKLKETARELRKEIVLLSMEDVTKTVIIEGAAEVWCDNKYGAQNQE